MVVSFGHSRKYLTPDAVLYLYKGQIRPKIGNCGKATQELLSCLDRVQNRLQSLVWDAFFSSPQPLSHKTDVAGLSLLYRYFHGKCLSDLQSIVPPCKAFTKKHTTTITNNFPRSLPMLKYKRKFYKQSFFHVEFCFTGLLSTWLQHDCLQVQFKQFFVLRFP